MAGSSFRWSPVGSPLSLFIFNIRSWDNLIFKKKCSRLFLVLDIIVTDGLWIVVDGGWSKKRFSDFPQFYQMKIRRYKIICFKKIGLKKRSQIFLNFTRWSSGDIKLFCFKKIRDAIFSNWENIQFSFDKFEKKNQNPYGYVALSFVRSEEFTKDFTFLKNEISEMFSPKTYEERPFFSKRISFKIFQHLLVQMYWDFWYKCNPR